MTPTKYTVGSQWRTRAGRKATVTANDLEETHPVAAKILTNGRAPEMMQRYTLQGRKYISPDKESRYDLLEPWREPVERWVVLALSTGKRGPKFNSFEDAVKWVDGRAYTIKRIWEVVGE